MPHSAQSQPEVAIQNGRLAERQDLSHMICIVINTMMDARPHPRPPHYSSSVVIHTLRAYTRTHTMRLHSLLSIQLMKMDPRDRHCLRHRGQGAMGARMRHFSHLSLTQVNVYITTALTGLGARGQTSIPSLIVTISFLFLPHRPIPDRI